MIPLIYHSIYSELPLPEGHRYPINKYRLLHDAINSEINANAAWQEQFTHVVPSMLDRQAVTQVHCQEYIDLLFSGTLPAPKMRRIGFPWSETLITRTLTSAGGTCETVNQSVEHGIAIHLSGGYHHAHHDFGSGFCLVNDLVLAAKRALTIDDIDKVLIVDSDVHHGDGTATLCADDASIVTLSFHCDKNFPARKPQSDLDVPLARESGDDEFLETFTSVVEMAVNLHQPDLILYDAGVDIHKDDELGYLSVSSEAIYKRDEFMFELAKRKQLPIACVVGGGYRSQHEELIPIHMQLIRAALKVYGR
ncbi:histone deacetylase/AcuC/AphA family protein [Vibrio orientalis CIP 102891 = ATCC 33934]|uniref:Histone deacetylase/AcuC/AphA family protein n=1 Tax=Vibrio orientalis CIP 102891 = ATCC 33934 TaxID=675816 RepID=C9QLW5_VIBOR|nr:histone deacetylase [Vibrio orientalis]EEX92891.1 histone deacetylase/AcuC/AphA family protein [Vibrio orientalis CIP 102891 = ATCC 33934]EGU46573.1 histone deacetylase/AcuC/AphA family protein [Vibrio orientalis CIP 102891 = ATCC 33934]